MKLRTEADLPAAIAAAAEKHRTKPCQSPAMANGQCRLHGGKSKGPKTLEGAERARQAVLRHGLYTAEAEAERRNARSGLLGLRAALASVG